jgi:hypothetical protein
VAKLFLCLGNRQFGRFGPLQNLDDICGGAPKAVRLIDSVAKDAAVLNGLAGGPMVGKRAAAAKVMMRRRSLKKSGCATE